MMLINSHCGVEEGGNSASVITAGVVCLLFRFIETTINNMIHVLLFYIQSSSAIMYKQITPPPH